VTDKGQEHLRSLQLLLFSSKQQVMVNRIKPLLRGLTCCLAAGKYGSMFLSQNKK